MSTVLIIVVLVLLLGVPGGYYGYRRGAYDGQAFGGIVVLILAVLLIAWLLGDVGGGGFRRF